MLTFILLIFSFASAVSTDKSCPEGSIYTDCEPCGGTCDNPNLEFYDIAEDGMSICFSPCGVGDFCTCKYGYIPRSLTDKTCVREEPCVEAARAKNELQ
uniref:uncharacterized protein LOC120343500 isoform X2 n=1 Tax=Styela clava TaxID=7725 RepID=UPI00193969F2|nr:uncharacterized protein LOC120343500 isoform X2 [Styela clava]